MIRIAPGGLHEALSETLFKTGDADLDCLLETAREKFLNRSLDIRKEGLEKLWDAWERLKTVEPGTDKKEMSKAILDKSAAEPVLRDRLEIEAKDLNYLPPANHRDGGHYFRVHHHGGFRDIHHLLRRSNGQLKMQHRRVCGNQHDLLHRWRETVMRDRYLTSSQS